MGRSEEARVAHISTLFPQSYEESRARFRQNLRRVQRLWPDARLECYPLGGDEDLTIDWIQAQGLERREKLLMFTTGEHGIEGYVGSAMLQLFLEEFLPRLEPIRTSAGLLLVHAINPWGMKHRRRTNGENVDLNRNFAWGPKALDTSANPDYGRLAAALNPQGPIRSLFWSDLSFFLKLLRHVASLGLQRFRRATLLGQYRFPRGIFYGGESLQEETRVLMDLYRNHIRGYEQVVHFDMHTGYGPRYQMSVVNSSLESRDSEELARRFSYPLVVKADASEFYAMQGDMIDYVYALVREELPEVRLYATSFEFGTLGDSLPAALRSLRAMVLENQMHWFGAASQNVRRRVEQEFRELYAPQEERWRAVAVADARRAFEGILRAEGFLAQE
jgi:predicted deacylase